jgi:hypothetical protein
MLKSAHVQNHRREMPQPADACSDLPRARAGLEGSGHRPYRDRRCGAPPLEAGEIERAPAVPRQVRPRTRVTWCDLAPSVTAATAIRLRPGVGP